jgi:hypothetical protein
LLSELGGKSPPLLPPSLTLPIKRSEDARKKIAFANRKLRGRKLRVLTNERLKSKRLELRPRKSDDGRKKRPVRGRRNVVRWKRKRGVGMRKSVNGKQRNSAVLLRRRKPKSALNGNVKTGNGPVMLVSTASSSANIKLASLLSLLLSQSERQQRAAASKSLSVSSSLPRNVSVDTRPGGREF